jgi:hypothetical protein
VERSANMEDKVSDYLHNMWLDISHSERRTFVKFVNVIEALRDLDIVTRKERNDWVSKIHKCPGHDDKQEWCSYCGNLIRKEVQPIKEGFHVTDLYTRDLHGFARMKVMRDVEFVSLGTRVKVAKKFGTVVGFMGLNLLVCFDGNDFASNCHPHYNIKYYGDDNTVIREFRG